MQINYLSTDKTNYSIFSPTSCTNTNHIDITIGSKGIMQVSSCKYLGVVIDDELTFKPHTFIPKVDKICWQFFTNYDINYHLGRGGFKEKGLVGH